MSDRLRLAASVIVAVVSVVGVAGVLTLAGESPLDEPPADTAASGDEVEAAAPAPGEVPHPDVPVIEAVLPEDVDEVRWGADVDGLLRFRGNLTHTFHGRGPLPADPEIAWRHPERPMCITERTTRQVTDEDGETRQVVDERQWCGTGWTGQPVIAPRDDGGTEVIIGGFDGLVYFLDGDTGAQLREPFRTGFQIKGTGALDPDGYPIYYTGSRDGRMRAIALDREPVEELWGIDAHPQRVWNNDWDGSPAIVDDMMLVGGEDSWFYAIELNRSYGPDGLVRVEPEVLVEHPGFDDELFRAIGDRNVSIENSVAVDLERDRVAFANSGGRVHVLALSALREGRVEVLLDVWLGDDIDASIVIDPDDGALYVAIELQRFLSRADEVGQVVRLDVDRPHDPIRWGVAVPPRRAGEDGGSWATPALHDGLLYVVTHPGDLLVLDTETGDEVFRDDLGWHSWSSPVIVDDGDGGHQLLVATCTDPHLRAYDLANPRRPRELWRLPLPGCIESTPAVWDGQIWVGSRDGYFYGIR